MDSQQYNRLTELFGQVCDLPPDGQSALLDEIKNESPEIHRELIALLAQDASGGLASCESNTVTMALNTPADQPLAEDTSGTLRLGNYELLEEIAQGGMGIVYRARQPGLDRIVAIKRIRSGHLASSNELQRFRSEAQAAAKLDHPGIVPIYEVGEQDGHHFFSMGFIEGQSLAQLLADHRPSVHESVRLLISVCDAMSHAHAHGVVHRDIKPSNILIDEQGQPHVTDFGLAKRIDDDPKLTTTGEILGTPSYMSPEQAFGDGEDIGPATDIYSIGAILYEMITGERVVNADNAIDAINQIRRCEPVPPRSLNRSIARDLETVCLKCLSRDPKNRYATVDDLAADLTRFLEGEPVSARRPNLARRLFHWGSRRPGLATTLIAMGVFYSYHLFNVYILPKPDVVTPLFHRVASIVVIIWPLGAWAFQRQLLLGHNLKRVLYGWVTLDVVLLTALLFAANGPSSPLTLGYYLLVAAAALRFRTDLVIFVTGISITGYMLHVIRAVVWRPDIKVSYTTAVPFLLGLLIICLIQVFLLRRLPRNEVV